MALGAKVGEFGCWETAMQYASGIVEEHLATCDGTELFGVSYMGPFIFRGGGVVKFLQACPEK